MHKTSNFKYIYLNLTYTIFILNPLFKLCLKLNKICEDTNEIKNHSSILVQKDLVSFTYTYVQFFLSYPY